MPLYCIANLYIVYVNLCRYSWLFMIIPLFPESPNQESLSSLTQTVHSKSVSAPRSTTGDDKIHSPDRRVLLTASCLHST